MFRVENTISHQSVLVLWLGRNKFFDNCFCKFMWIEYIDIKFSKNICEHLMIFISVHEYIDIVIIYFSSSHFLWNLPNIDRKIIFHIIYPVNEKCFFSLRRLLACKITIYLWKLFFVTLQTPNPFAKEVNLLDILLICIASNYILDDLTFWFQCRLRTIFSAQIKFKK